MRVDIRDSIATGFTIIAAMWVGYAGLIETGFIIPAFIVMNLYTLGMIDVWLNLRKE